MADRRELVIGPGGNVRAIYFDDLTEIMSAVGGTPAVRRASHVEPTDDGRWTADMGPSGGPVLGPFARRQQALDAEVQWINDNVLSDVEGGGDGEHS